MILSGSNQAGIGEMDMKELLLGTNNKGKVEEMSEILKHLDIRLLTPAMLGLELEVSEDGNTYEDNATLKAVAFSKASGLPCLADDSGLEVDCAGWPTRAAFSPICPTTRSH